MPIHMFYWEPCITEPPGHLALSIDGAYQSFWPLVVKPEDGHGVAPGMVNTDSRKGREVTQDELDTA